jgi:hypothetical protein
VKLDRVRRVITLIGFTLANHPSTVKFLGVNPWSVARQLDAFCSLGGSQEMIIILQTLGGRQLLLPLVVSLI